eukprot:2728-Amorphochlora_amoeboformis.AAC.2
MADGPISVKPKGQSSIVKQDNAPFESIKPHSKRRLNPDTTESAPSSAAASVQVDSAMKLDQEGFQSGDRKRGALKGWLRIGKRGRSGSTKSALRTPHLPHKTLPYSIFPLLGCLKFLYSECKLA